MKHAWATALATLMAASIGYGARLTIAPAQAEPPSAVNPEAASEPGAASDSGAATEARAVSERIEGDAPQAVAAGEICAPPLSPPMASGDEAGRATERPHERWVDTTLDELARTEREIATRQEALDRTTSDLAQRQQALEQRENDLVQRKEQVDGQMASLARAERDLDASLQLAWQTIAKNHLDLVALAAALTQTGITAPPLSEELPPPTQVVMPPPPPMAPLIEPPRIVAPRSQ